ncbi:MAG TPA: DUF4388 domain-containing protein [Syntrophorhabdaceae bacterium]|nr:DUF4388 domain-containing protein [Syntrophorhabdaceae bacterium]
MPNDFIGDLTKTRLFDLIKPLLDKKKSGMIQIKGNETGELYIEGANIIHARTGDLAGEDAVLAMMEWGSGRATFDWEASTDEQTVFMPTEQLLMIWTNRENEWNAIREYIPSPNVVFRIPLNGGPEDKNIHASQWKILALCNGTKSVAEIAETLQWPLFETSKALCQMAQDGLLERASEKKADQTIQIKRTVNGNFFPIIETELRKVMGPIASIIIDDKLADFGESRDAFPEDRLPPFVQSVGEEITDKTKRASFTRSMTEFLARKQK